MFIREFAVIDSATSVKQLKMRLKENELEQYGKAFIPEFVYEVIRHKSRFSTMRVSQIPLLSFSFNLSRGPLSRGMTLIEFSVGTNKMRKSSWGFFWKSCMKNVVER